MRPKKVLTSVAVQPAPVRVPSQRPLALSVASVTSVGNNKDDNETIMAAEHRSPGIGLGPVSLSTVQRDLVQFSSLKWDFCLVKGI